MQSLKGKTLFITGASRGIGLAIALRAARDGANIVIAAKSNVPNPKLPFENFADKWRTDGGLRERQFKAWHARLKVDIRDEAQVQAAVEQAVA